MMSQPAGVAACMSIVLAAATGCYAYVPVEPGGADPGTIVRAEVTEQAASELTSRLGPGVLELRGTVIDRDEKSLALVLESYTSTRAGELSANGEAVRLPFDGFRQVEQKRFSRSRSLLFGVIFVAGAATVTGIAIHESRVLDRQQDPDPNQQDRRKPAAYVPLLRIRFP